MTFKKTSRNFPQQKLEKMFGDRRKTRALQSFYEGSSDFSPSLGKYFSYKELTLSNKEFPVYIFTFRLSLEFSLSFSLRAR